jgi:hypothetical protein
VYKFEIGQELKYIGMDMILSGRKGTVLKRQTNNPITNKQERSYLVKFELRKCWIKEYELEEVPSD